MNWDRFDICAAWYIFTTLHHDGQWSFLYQKLSQLVRMRYKPSLTVERCKFENENQFAIYENLKKRFGRNDYKEFY